MRRAALLLVAPLCASCLAFHQGPLPGAKGTFADVGGVPVRYVDMGEGPAVVMIHGFASALETWTGLAAELKASHRVIALDLKGFGLTGRPPGDYSPAAQADLVLALLDQRGVKRAAFVAHSYGVSVALQIALKAPDRVTRLALYDAWVYDDQLPTLFLWARARGVGEALFGLFYNERPEDKLAQAFFDPTIIPEQLVEDIERNLARPGTRAAALAAVRGMRYAELARRYREIDKPALLLWGREDRVTPVAVGERLLHDLKQARLVVFPRCGPLPMVEAARPSNAEVVRFLASAEAR